MLTLCECSQLLRARSGITHFFFAVYIALQLPSISFIVFVFIEFISSVQSKQQILSLRFAMLELNTKIRISNCSLRKWYNFIKHTHKITVGFFNLQGLQFHIVTENSIRYA